MTLDRRTLLAQTGVAMAAAGASACGRGVEAPAWRTRSGDEWDDVRGLFALSPGVIHMSAMLISSHPEPVRRAIDRHRRRLDADPVTYLNRNNVRLQRAAREAAGRYLGVDGADIALTDSTTMGLGLVYNGLRLRPGQEIVSTEQDYYATHEAIRLAAERTGAVVRHIPLYERIDTVSEGEIVDRIARAVTPATRVVALTWVHSSTGLKLPIGRIAEAIETANAGRDEDDRALLCVDAVHGFGNQDATLGELGCDFLMAGCHKWLFGPRGTGVVAANRRGWAATRPTIPSFIDDGSWDAWLAEEDPRGSTTAARMTPGGFKAFEHQWALTEAFDLHREIGKARIEARTHALAAQLKVGLAAVPGVRLHTPRAEALSAGIVAFDVEGLSPSAVVRRLRERRIIGSVAPYATPHARLTPSIRNTPAEIDIALREIRALAG